MKKFGAVAALVAAVAASLFAARADAILFGRPDGNDHKGVGYIVFYDDDSVPLWRCTGSLVSRVVLLTAGHCAGTFESQTGPDTFVEHTPRRAQVWFDKEIDRGNYPGTGSCRGFRGWPCSGGDALGVPIPHPDYAGDHEGTVNDLGIVLLLRPQNSRDVLDLAKLGSLDKADAGDTYSIVGFGTQSTTPPPVDQRQRMRGSVTFIGIDEEAPFVDFTNSQKFGVAACQGDSGGPVLDKRGDIVAVIALVDPTAGSQADGYCSGLGYHTRTDTSFAADFLEQFRVNVQGDGGHDGRHHGWKFGRGWSDYRDR